MPHSRGSAKSSPGPALTSPGAGQVLCALCALAALCVCNPPAGFHRSMRNRDELKGISWEQFPGRDLSQRYSFHGLECTTLWLSESVIQMQLSMIQSRSRELQCLSPFTHVWTAKSILKLFVPHCLTVINLSSLLLEAKGVVLQDFTEPAQLKWNVWWRIVKLFWLRFGNDKKNPFWEQKNTWFSHFSPT